MNYLLIRLHALRLNAPIALLILLLQRTPVLQALVRADIRLPSSAGNLIRSALVAVVSGSTVHTLTGATKFTSNPVSPASATVGTSFTLVFAVTGAPSVPGSYKITGTIPPGLSVPGMSSTGILNASSGSISGTPTQPGSYITYIQAYEKANATGNTNNVKYPVQIDVTGSQSVAPAITSQPQSLTVTAGSNVSFSVTATGTPAPAFQWQKNGANLAGATLSTLSLANVQSADAANYTVVVSNSAGSVTSNTATLTVNPAPIAPAITSQPQSLAVTAGSNASFSVTATGTPAPAFQWQKNGANLAGATSSTLSLTNVQSADAANYTVVVSNSAGSVTSNTATLTVNPAPVAPAITSQPQSLTVTASSNANFSVTATGTPSPSYQWHRNGANIAGATSSTLSLTNVQSADAANYTVVVSNSAGSVTSNTATLTVNPAPVAPSISQQPRSLMLPAGYPGAFSVAASAPGAGLQYQWRKDGAALPGATSPTLAFASAQPADSGSYSVTVTSSGGSVTSDPATLLVGSDTARLVNMSCRGSVETGAKILIPGMYVTGGATKRLLIRAIGPTLGSPPYNVPGALQDPFLRVYNSQGEVLFSNDNWGDGGKGAELAALFQQAGAFSLPQGSKDAVIVADIPPYRGITYHVTGADGGTGIAIVEVYEVGGDGRISNMSTRGFVGLGAELMIPGVGIAGDKPKTLLIRAVGPSIGQAPYNVPGALADPVVMVMDASGREILANDDWGDAPNLDAIRPVMQRVGAFPLIEGSRDAVILAVLPPGTNTFHVTGKGGSSGVALVEIYEVPDGP